MKIYILFLILVHTISALHLTSIGFSSGTIGGSYITSIPESKLFLGVFANSSNIFMYGIDVKIWNNYPTLDNPKLIAATESFVVVSNLTQTHILLYHPKKLTLSSLTFIHSSNTNNGMYSPISDTYSNTAIVAIRNLHSLDLYSINRLDKTIHLSKSINIDKLYSVLFTSDYMILITMDVYTSIYKYKLKHLKIDRPNVYKYNFTLTGGVGISPNGNLLIASVGNSIHAINLNSGGYIALGHDNFTDIKFNKRGNLFSTSKPKFRSSLYAISSDNIITFLQYIYNINAVSIAFSQPIPGATRFFAIINNLTDTSTTKYAIHMYEIT